MWIALIIVAGLTAMTVIAAGFDYLGKRKLRIDQEFQNRVLVLEQKVDQLQAELLLKNSKIDQLGEDLTFLNKLIDDQSKK